MLLWKPPTLPEEKKNARTNHQKLFVIYYNKASLVASKESPTGSARDEKEKTGQAKKAKQIPNREGEKKHGGNSNEQKIECKGDGR